MPSTSSERGERVSYKVLSDTSRPSDSSLRADREFYPEQVDNYLQLPHDFDNRIGQLSAEVTELTRNRFDAAVAVERYLQTQFGYTLEMKAGGDDPLADFLFNVREGHCEYFASAMALMLRSQGIATRVVTGFQQGEYNETADVFVVRQRQAHAWVEVYFPGVEAWVSFDPTPSAGRDAGLAPIGVSAKLTKYLEALEMFWIQYFVAFDNQEQRSLFSSVKKSFIDYQSRTSSYVDTVQILVAEWWKDVRGENGFETRAAAIGYAAAALIGTGLIFFAGFWLIRRLRRLAVWSRIRSWFRPSPKSSVVEFYERMLKLLSERGFIRPSHQTPLEFAAETGFPQAVLVTEKYNLVRFGQHHLTAAERKDVETWLAGFEGKG